MKLYMAVTNDKYEIPIAVTENPVELERMYKMPKGTIGSYIQRGTARKKDGVKFVKVELGNMSFKHKGDNMSITGEDIRKARKAAGLTQKELGDKLGVSQPAVGQLENSSNVRPEALEKIAAALGLSYSFTKDGKPHFLNNDLKGMRLYISGKMTGLTAEKVKRNFIEAEIKLKDAGFRSINPNRFKLPDLSYSDYMQIDFKLIDLCDGIFMQDNWTDSKGARCERNYAIATGKRVFEEDSDGNIVEV